MDKKGNWRLSPAYDVMFSANTWEDPSAHIHAMGVMGKRSALTTSDFIEFAEDFVENPQDKIIRVFLAVREFRMLCNHYQIDKKTSELIQTTLEGLVSDDMGFLQST